MKPPKSSICTDAKKSLQLVHLTKNMYSVHAYISALYILTVFLLTSVTSLN